MGATKCPKFKKHQGLSIIPIKTPNVDNFGPGFAVIYNCETTETRQTLKCLEDGRWSESLYCPDPSNMYCPDLKPFENGRHNASSGPQKVGTTVYFECNNEILTQITKPDANSPPQQYAEPRSSNIYQQPGSSSYDDIRQTIATTINYNPTTVTNVNTNLLNEVDTPSATTTGVYPLNSNNMFTSNAPNMSLATPYPSLDRKNSTHANIILASDQITRYNLTGPRYIRCLPSQKWSNSIPICSPIQPEKESNVRLFVTSAIFIIIPILIIFVILQLFIRWKKRQQQRARIKQYFTDYKNRHSKSSIAFGVRSNQATSNVTIPVTDL